MKKYLVIFLLIGCSYGIKQERELASYSHRAKDSCKKDSNKCADAKMCITAALEGITTIQQTQENKLKNRINSVDEFNSIFSYKEALKKCQQF